ncbi:pentatricopeptide repeat-containing protein At4g19191, mitochondrial-like [Cryptomeria japonica]|uniref:pentatricopeptide repeat-containing protein At4g19191, mitochondrial-like n=1 Tax=Cryptomeria japonica TaxID=3369 RepID=UPI0025AB7924|nr:pentatricopeptide repeat-containing protein At4g19191, mitochondrial-like [Cryptomeria japonica]
MPERDVVSWTLMIAGYAQMGLLKMPEIFQQMQLAGVNSNFKIFLSVLSACAKFGDMYAKCGNVHKARKLFYRVLDKNVASWTTIVLGYAMHGCGRDALKISEQCNTLQCTRTINWQLR